jgi:long-subunit fatty acid transport protein
MMKHKYIFLFLLFSTSQLFAQFGGETTYDFLNLTSSARVNALGGNQVGMNDSSEISFSFYNPAMLRPSMHKGLSVNYIDYVSDINIGYAAYAHHIKGFGMLGVGMQYSNYGKFEEALETGEKTGKIFRAADYAFNLIYSRNITDKISVGLDVKPIYSVLESYSSFGIAADLGISYIDSSGNFSCGLVAKNMGRQLTTYQNNDNAREPLPFDLQAGFAQRLAHAPFQFNVTLQHLQNWNLTDKTTWDYDHKDEDEFPVGKSDDVVKQFMRHVILGVEFIPTDNFLIGLGYNFQRRWELSYSENPGAVGLSGGFTVKVSKFRISYAIASYHLSSTSNTFSISTNLSEFIR